MKEENNLFREMIENGVVPNVFTLNTLIDRHCKDGDLDEAFRLNAAMMENGIIPNVVTYS